MHDDEVRDFQSNLAFERLSRGISQSRLAREIGITQTHLSYIEHGVRRLTPARYHMILDFFREFDGGCSL